MKFISDRHLYRKRFLADDEWRHGNYWRCEGYLTHTLQGPTELGVCSDSEEMNF